MGLFIQMSESMKPGEYFAFSILGKNYHGIGLFDDTTDSDGNGTSDHLAELQAGNTSRYKGVLWAMWIHPTTAAWTYYGEQNVAPTVSSGFTGLEGYYSSDALIKWQTSVEYQNLATTPVGMKVGIDPYGYLVVSYFNVVENRYVFLLLNSTLLCHSAITGFTMLWDTHLLKCGTLQQYT